LTVLLKKYKSAVFIVCLFPLLFLIYDVWQEYQSPGSALGADPAVSVVHFLGNWAIRFLLITLTLSSLTRSVKTLRLIPYRRMLGLFAFSYVCLHFSAYFLLLAGAEFNSVLADFIKRPYISMGISALVLLIPLAVTSTAYWQRRLRKNWKRLHRLMYPIGMLVVIHVAWLAKSSYLEAVVYSTWLIVLFGERFFSRKR
jgi:sulfoxide reductase heme-binding subunit YedZ